MGVAIYIARRDLAPSHFAGSSYSLILKLSELAFKGSDLKTTPESLSGKVETLYLGRQRIWSVTLAPVEERTSAIIREFLGSTADGQQFTFDPYGSEGFPIKAMTVIRSDTGFSERPFIRSGDPAGRDYVEFSFEVRQV